jgi:RNA polymerase sigma factor (sigma-70 family)
VRISKTEAKKLLTLSQDMLFLDSLVAKDSNTTFASQLQDTIYASIEESFIKQELHEKLNSSIKKLKPEEQKVLKMHYGLTGCEPEAFSSIAKKIGKSRARVHQIERYAMKRLEKELLASGF